PGRGAARARPRGRWDGDLVAGDAAAGVAPRAGWLAAGEHLHDLVGAAGRGLELAAGPLLVPDRHRLAHAPAGPGPGPRSRCRPQKKLIEQAYTEAEARGLAVGCQDEAGPFPTMPYPGASWHPEGHPTRQLHEYLRVGTAKLLTLFRPATGHVQVKGVTRTTNAVL